MKKAPVLWSVLLIFNGWSIAAADTILGVYAGASYWQHDLADDINSNLSNSKRSESGNIYYLALEHPVPFLPNIKLQQNNIDGQKSGTFDLIGIDGVIREVRSVSKADFSHTDLMLYYEVLDNWVNLDLGLAIKQFNGSAPFNRPGQHVGARDIDDLIPMLYGKGEFDLPFTGLSVYGSIEALSLGNDDITDLELGLNYESKAGLGGVLGYRALNVDFEQNNATTDAHIDGFFLGINFHF
jgi:outer membrane protein